MLAPLKVKGIAVKEKANYLYNGSESFTVSTESLILLRFARTVVFRLLLINHPVVLGRGLSWPKLAVHEHRSIIHGAQH